jgi:pyruvate dehydrogenase E1 component alpha subunit
MEQPTKAHFMNLSIWHLFGICLLFTLLKIMDTPWVPLNPRHSAGDPLARRADSFDINWSVTNGHDIYEVRQTISDALKLAHEESKPSVLEIVTYRYRGHSVADPDQTYRSKEEIEEYKINKDPINLFKNKLIDEKNLTDEVIKEIDIKAKGDADASAEFADASPYPEANELMDDIYWETDNPDKKTSQGTMFFETPPQ